MAGITDMNIDMGKGNRIRKIHHVKKQDLEVSKKDMTQPSKNNAKKHKSRDQKSGPGGRIGFNANEEERKGGRSLGGQEDQKGRKSNDKQGLPEAHQIDIRV